MILAIKDSIKLIIEGRLDDAIKKMLENHDLEQAKTLMKLYPSHEWHGLDEKAKKIVELYSFDPKELGDLARFIHNDKGFKATYGAESKLT